MNYIKIKKYDVANGPGVRVTIFVAGCPHEPKCPNCFNPETYDFHGGNLFDEDVFNEFIQEAQKSHIEGITLLGGEPMDLRNQKGLLPLVKKFKELCPNKTVWCFSGFLFEDILKMYEMSEITKELLPLIDIIVDGKFVDELKSPMHVFRGSSNQRIIKVKESLETNTIKEWEKPKYC